MRPRFDKLRRDVTSKEIDGITDLVVWAPIKEGFIDAFVNVTYETRLRVVAEALHSVRKSAREYEDFEPFADTAKRILSLLDFRIGIVDRDVFGEYKVPSTSRTTLRPRKFMYLVATFDGAWEPYIREIWRPLGYFLDLVLCNCEGYVAASDSSFEEYAQWVRDNQLDSAIFYSTSGLTVEDKIYLSDVEQILLHHHNDNPIERVAKHTFKHPDEAANEEMRRDPERALTLGAEALNVLYKLTDFYPPTFARQQAGASKEMGEGRFLLNATRELLRGFDPDLLPAGAKEFLANQIEWFKRPIGKFKVYEDDDDLDCSDIQKGLLTEYDEGDAIITHGALLMSRITDPDKFRRFLEFSKWSWEDDPTPGFLPPDSEPILFGPGFFLNIAFSFNGLVQMQVPEGQLRMFPKEFRQGMQERAPLLGDEFANHPRNWKLPVRNWPNDTDKVPPIEPSEIDFVIQVRASLRDVEKGDPENEFYRFSEGAKAFIESANQLINEQVITSLAASDPAKFVSAFDGPNDDFLRWFIDEYAGAGLRPATKLDAYIAIISALGKAWGFSILGIEDMIRQDAVNNKLFFDGDPSASRSITTDHFGFQDGISQPVVKPTAADLTGPTDVLKGDVLYGYRNTRGDFREPNRRHTLLHNGSFMVIRKMSQNRAVLDQIEKVHGTSVVEKMVGRTRDGKPLVKPKDRTNQFDYENDTEGLRCPLSAHIRLANPRTGNELQRDPEILRYPPKILRRGMSFGKRHEQAPDQERGIVFIAHCSSIAEQYEVIQRWLNAGNATGVSSTLNDPLTGVQARKGRRVFRCFDNGTLKHVELTESLVTLNWGEYFFVPSQPALKLLAQPAAASNNSNVLVGEQIIKQIEQLDPIVQRQEWKRLLEDYLAREPTQHNLSSPVWQAIQAQQGAYRIENGVEFDENHPLNGIPVVLVTDADEIQKIFDNEPESIGDTCPYSTREQLARCSSEDSFGAIFVAIDEDVPPYPANGTLYGSYEEESYPANTILMNYPKSLAFQVGHRSGTAWLDRLKAGVMADPSAPREFKIELGGQYIQPALAGVCKAWFGLPDGAHFESGSWNWKWIWDEAANPVCPGDFLAPSRHAFYPRPTNPIDEIGRIHGSKLRRAIKSYVSQYWDRGEKAMPGAVVDGMYKDLLHKAKSNPAKEAYFKDLLGRNIIGIMVGALPPTEANLRSVFYEGLEERSLWNWQDAYISARQLSNATPWSAAQLTLVQPLAEAMSIRPAPDLLYRTVKNGPVKIGGVTANEGETVILCLSGATQQVLRETGEADVSLVFGGTRKDPDHKAPHPNPEWKHPLHACPAKDMANGAMMGIMAALFDAGRIQAMPASLIVRISDWR